MFENLPTWVTAGATPAGAVIAFFWKGDDALSSEFKQWLGQKISGARLTTPDIATIEPLGQVFSLVYGNALFSLATLLRVFAVSTCAFIVWCIAHGGLGLRGGLAEISLTVLLMLLVINIFFDFLSVTKSRLIIQRFAKKGNGSGAFKVILSDTMLTTVILAIYWITVFVVTEIFAFRSFQSGAFGHVGNYTFGRNAYIAEEHDLVFYMTQIPFLATMAITLILSVLYSCSLLLLELLGYLGQAANLGRWMLPVQTLPIRSIGIVSGVLAFIVFGGIAVVHSSFFG
jgi:hypothetical protein